jgi:hypothetical protein
MYKVKLGKANSSSLLLDEVERAKQNPLVDKLK